MLTLNEALRTDRLEDFIAQAEAEGVEAADRQIFDVIVARAPQVPAHYREQLMKRLRDAGLDTLIRRSARGGVSRFGAAFPVSAFYLSARGCSAGQTAPLRGSTRVTLSR